jgi:hypothetical protein
MTRRGFLAAMLAVAVAPMRELRRRVGWTVPASLIPDDPTAAAHNARIIQAAIDRGLSVQLPRGESFTIALTITDHPADIVMYEREKQHINIRYINALSATVRPILILRRNNSHECKIC